MERFDDYWGKVPNVDRVILRPIPELTTRAAALEADEVDWIDVPPSDAIPGLIDKGFVLYTKPYPHIYPYQINIARKPGIISSSERPCSMPLTGRRCVVMS